MFKIIFLVIFTMSTLSCSQSWDRAMVNDLSAKDVKTTQLEYYDSELFDLELSKALLSNSPKLTINITTSFTVDQIPKRLGIWLSAIKNRGGNVTTKPDPDLVKTRAFLEMIYLIVQFYSEIKELFIYSVADNYNATVFYNSSDNVVTKIIFETR